MDLSLEPRAGLNSQSKPSFNFEQQHLELLFEAQEWDLALKAAMYLMQVSDCPRSLFIAASCLYHLHQDEDAIHFYLRYVGRRLLDSEDVYVAFKNLGNLFLRSGDVEAAEEWYLKAFRLCPQSDTLLVNLGVLHTQTRDYNRALDFYRRAVSTNPSNESGWLGLAIIHRELSDYELANGNLQQVLDLNPDNKIALELIQIWNQK